MIAPVRHESGSIIKTPRARPGRVANLDPVKDGLAYATAMRGLWRSGIGGERAFRYVPGLRIGEDLAPGLAVYYSGANILFPRRGLAYVMGNEAEDRATGIMLPLSEEFAAVFSLPLDELHELSLRHRTSIACKLARTSLIGSLTRRGAGHKWSSEELDVVQHLAAFLDNLAPGYRDVMPVADARLLADSLKASLSGADFGPSIQRHQQANFVSRLFSRRVFNNFSREGQIRQVIRAALDRRS